MVKELSELYNDPIIDPRRYYSPATIKRFDSRKDMMLLRASKNSLLLITRNYLLSNSTPPNFSLSIHSYRSEWCYNMPEGHTTHWSHNFKFQGVRSDYTRRTKRLHYGTVWAGGCSGAPILNQGGQLHCVYNEHEKEDESERELNEWWVKGPLHLALAHLL